MGQKELTRTSKFLLFLLASGEALSIFFPTPRELRRRAYWGKFVQGYPDFKNLVYYLHRKGYVKFENKQSQRFIKLTEKGELEALLQKALLPHKPQRWDGKWRIIMYDIPEESKEKRKHFRGLLKQYGFYKLQHSVFINPYPLSRDAVTYLKKKKLIQYIRIIKVEEIDDDGDLRKLFHLQ